MTTLADSAFGVDPGHWPLPSAHGAEEHWLRAVAAGGQGRYAAALADLDAVTRCADRGPFRSLAESTRASVRRQLGWHASARPLDGRALAFAGADPDARADALIGLAADALGVGRFALSARLLDRARPDAAAGSARLPVRLAWVGAELAMATGRGADAVHLARDAVALAAPLGSVRHAVKSDVVHAAALCCAAALDDARGVADRALDAAQATGLVPLSWALSCLLGDIGSASHSAADVAAIRADSAALVQVRGGTWSQR
jgi:hypothetical protein